MRQKALVFALLILLATHLTPALLETSELDAFDSADITIGVPTGSAAMGATEARFPNAKIQYMTVDNDGYISVVTGKIDAYAHDTIVLKYACEENPQLRLLDATYGETDIAVGISRTREDLAAPVNAFIQELIASGTRDDMLKRWLTDAENAMPSLPDAEAHDKTIRVGTSGIVVPMTYYGADQTLTGFDIEFLKRLGIEMNAHIEISVMNYDALVAGLESGKLDMVIANLNITPERAQRIAYSIPYMTAATGIVVKNDVSSISAAQPGFRSLEEYQAYFSADKRLGITVGTIFDGIVQKLFPDAQRVYYNTNSDLIVALNAGKIDGYLVDKPQGYAQCLADDTLWMPDVLIADDNYGIALAFGNEDLRARMNEIIARYASDGTFDALEQKWFLTDEAQKPMPDIPLSGEKGVLRLATTGDSYPFSYIRDGETVGYSIEAFRMICAELGYDVEIVISEFSGMIASVSSGKADAASDCISITAERKEQMLFTEPTYKGGMMMMLPASLQGGAGAAGQDGEEGIWASIAASFERTFIRENRWKLIAQGLLTTLIISVCAAILGTVLGFGVCMARRSRFGILSGIAKAFIQIMQGTPIVVFLMILYYIVFGDVDPVLVAVVGFALNFAAYVSEMMRTGIDAVDKGQIEAASAIGFTKTRAFTLITLPQAARHFLPVFRGEFISLVKMTSVVGYISIMDLTKMSDIIRSRTYEAFFPLIATAVIYFLLSWILAQCLSALERRIDPKRKKRVIRGVREEATMP